MESFCNSPRHQRLRRLFVSHLLAIAITPFSANAGDSPQPQGSNPYLAVPTVNHIGQNGYDPFIAKGKNLGVNQQALGEHFYLKLSLPPSLTHQSSKTTTSNLQQTVNQLHIDIANVLAQQQFQLTPVYSPASPASTRTPASTTASAAKKPTSHWYKLSAAGNVLADPALIKQISALPQVEYLEQEVLFTVNPQSHTQPTAVTTAPLEAELSEQWYLSNIKAPQVWQHMLDNNLPAGGSPDVVVAVIDTGVDYLHRDLINNLWINPAEIPNNNIDDDFNGIVDDVYGADFTGETASGDPKDDNGHGTHVSGIIAAQGDNDVGIKGIAHNVKVMNVKAAQYSGILTSGAVVAAIHYAVANGADVINMSFGGSNYSRMIEETLAEAYSDAVLVASAGNQGRYNDNACGDGDVQIYPAVFNWVIGVMAMDQTPSDKGELLSSFSNWDCLAGDGFEYELMVPGSDILSTVPNNGYARWDGTSMAAPMVSAMAALARSKWPNKNDFGSRFIAGQLVSTGESQLGIIDKINGVAHYFPTLNGLNTLVSAPQPSLSFHSHWLFDDKGIAASNDSDGRPDAGELIHLGLTLHNHWGKAKQVSVTLSAKTPLGEVSPYIEMVNDTVAYGDFGSFSNQDNGLITNDGQVTGVSQPFKIRLAADTPNNTVIPFTVQMTAKNGLDENDSNDYVFSQALAFELQVQRGFDFPIFIGADMTLTKDKLWIINQPSMIQAGVTVTVEPGTQIQFHSSDLAANQQDELPAKLVVQGKLIVQGSADEPIGLFPAALKPAYEVNIEATEGGVVSMDYVNIMNPVLQNSNGVFNIDHGYLTQHSFWGIWHYNESLGYFNNSPPRLQLDSLNHSRVDWLGFYVIEYLKGMNVEVESITTSSVAHSNLNTLSFGEINTSVLLTNVRTVDGLLPMNSNQFVASAITEIGPQFNEKTSLLSLEPKVYGNSTYTSMTLLSTSTGNIEVDLKRFQLANQYANYLGGSIAMIKDDQELADVAEYLANNANNPNVFADLDCGLHDCDRYFPAIDSGYIGLTDLAEKGRFEWVDGSVLDYQPDTFFTGSGRFVYMHSNPFWSTMNFLNSQTFLLELPATIDGSQINQLRQDFIEQRFNGQNALLNRWWDTSDHWQIFDKGIQANDDRFGEWFHTLANNYWGTNNLELIENSVSDFFDGHFAYDKVRYQPIAQQASSETYPFVLDIQLTTAGQTQTNEVGSELVTFNLTFNRDMDTQVQPKVHFGPAMPLTDHQVIGDWTDSRTWVGQYQVSAHTGDGFQYLRVTDARAADDAWLVISNDLGRFRFNINTQNVESAHLTATSEAGYIEINWDISEQPLLQGLNIYRADSLDGPYVRIVQRLLATSETRYQDRSVVAGQTYFYKVSQVFDGREAALSAAVSTTAVANGELDNLQFIDEPLAACVRQAVSVNRWTKISQVTQLGCVDKNISDLSGLEVLTALTKLDLRRNQLTSIAPLADLIGLTELKLSKNQINDITALANLTGLTMLSMSGNQFDQGMLAALAKLSRLQILYIRDSQLSNIKPLVHLSQLQQLYLSGNQISDITLLYQVPGLVTLELSNNQIQNVAALFNLNQAKLIDLRNNNQIKCLYLNALDMVLGTGVVIHPASCIR